MSRVQKNGSSPGGTASSVAGIADAQAETLATNQTDGCSGFDQASVNGDDDSQILHGPAVIRQFWEHAPAGPGVYRMIGAGHEVLYVGKAKNVRKRIASYMRASGQTTRIARMIGLTVSMVFVSTATETEALLLEINLIKQLKPRFNVLLRDDKSFPYILLTGDHAAPQITKHRGARNQKGDYFGPFASVLAVNRTLNALQRAFLLRSCSDSFYANRTRPCLLYQIRRCSAPCTGEIALAEYENLVREARDFLSGKSRTVRERLAAEMTEAANLMEFERAARLRDRIAALSAIQGAQGINPKTVEEADVFAIAEQAGQFCVEVFFFRTFQNWGNRAYFPRADKSLSPGEVLDAFVAQFYADTPPPRLILLSHDIENRAILEEALRERARRAIEIAVPRKGEKKDLVEQAGQNARAALGRKLSETASQAHLLAALGSAFGLSGAPRRIEVYDNSHIMGTNAVGAMIVAGADGFMKMHYRTFNIKSLDLTPGDDYAMMREVLRRRFARLLKDEAAMPEVNEVLTGANGEAAREMTPTDEAPFPDRPDLILIDGGKGQFEAARAILKELGVTGVAVASIAKGVDRNAGRESFFVEDKEPFKLSPRDPALYFVQRLRDEAHRFAIGTHRARRKKEFTQSPLDEIPGIGPARKRALLHAFGTAKAISRAALPDFEKVPGINAATARRVYDFFHERGR
ncbi:excinuclease ABC subunit UvrC [Methylocapsa sp. D3K7]|uniref:excinuclease ABC subunit UvrC n=1 Tax=Methylocapsa sp. D3K7 TaxID=3041435 RepID=UPI00244E68C9|nr:excinuclease ABC subunit UvrC [Methylocapsa sp. D3K7]WGJ14704.1 excinuclease ABC subunit UvrC [Methylocapsa sp. D3K7]